jgi:hypothetical protein
MEPEREIIDFMHQLANIARKKFLREGETSFRAGT